VIVDNKWNRGRDRSLAIAMDNIIPVMPDKPEEKDEFAIVYSLRKRENHTVHKTGMFRIR
jgi:hypothetical protein